MRLKHSVNPIGLKTEMLLAGFIIDGVYKDFKHECVATSINDSVHHETSRHYQGMAIDFRIRHLPTGYEFKITNEVSYKPRKP